MAAHTPTLDYTVTRAPHWVIASRTRQAKDHTVTQVEAADGSSQLFCSCEAGMYGRQCWHREWVKDGRAGKPTLRIRPAAPTSAPRPTVDTDSLYSDAGAAAARSVTSVRAAVAS